MALRRWLPMVGLVPGLLLTVSPASATEGTLVVTVDRTLTEDHSGNIEVPADNVTLDCGGHDVSGDGSTTGIAVTGLGVTVVNCSLTAFDIGIEVKGSNANLNRNTVADSRLGFVVSGDQNTITANEAVHNKEVGFEISASNSDFSSNWSERSGLADFSLIGASSVQMVENVSDRGFIGFLADGNSEYISFTRNQALRSISHGFHLRGTHWTGLAGNLAMGTGGDGFHLSDENEAAGLLHNHSHRNQGRGFFDDGLVGIATIGPDVGLPPPTNVYWYEVIPLPNTPYDDLPVVPTNKCVGNGSPGVQCDESGSFFDDDGNIFEVSIEWLAWMNITNGCNPPASHLFCPDDFVTRGQMAAFLVRALGYTDDGGGDLFTDDDGSTFEADIDKLGTAGVSKGCNPPDNTLFCPDDFVTRDQMAAFLVRAMGYTDDGGGDLFTDDDGSIFEADIDKLGTAGVTKGCNPPDNTLFCPDDFVTRDQMAAFLHRALGR